MTEGAPLRKILLPLDVSRDSLTALEIAFDLAAALGSEVAGLFIEDADLFAAGSLPFAREIGSSTGIRRRISSADIEHRFRAVASKARETLAEAGRRAVQFAQELARSLGWEIVVFTSRGAASGDDVLQRIPNDNPRLVVLPASLPLTKRASQLKCPVLFVP